jgi:hypothetical protein
MAEKTGKWDLVTGDMNIDWNITGISHTEGASAHITLQSIEEK